MDWGAFAAWIDKIEPGSWSEWVGSILTGFSLILAFSILRRDRTKERRAQAARVIPWFDDDGDQCVIRIQNTSDLPIFGPTLMTRPRRAWSRRRRRRMQRRKQFKYRVYQYRHCPSLTVEPGETWINPFPFPKSDATYYRTVLRLQDSAGVIHLRDASYQGDKRFMAGWTHYTENFLMGIGTIIPAAERYLSRGQALPTLERGDGYEFIVDHNGRNAVLEVEPLDGRGTE